MNVSSDTSIFFGIVESGSKEDILRICQEEKEIDLNGKNAHGKSVLTMTLENKNLKKKDIIDVLKYFLDQGVDPDIGNRFGETTLNVAAKRLMKDVVDLLIERQAKVKKIGRDGYMITHDLIEDWSSKYTHNSATMSDADLEIFEKESASYIEWLISKGFDFEHKNSYRRSGLSMSLHYGLLHIALAILKHAKHTDVIYDLRHNLLHALFYSGKSENWHKLNSRYKRKIVKILLDKRVSAIAFNKNNLTPLWMAVAGGEDLDIIEMLLDRLVWSNSQRSDVITKVLIELFKASKHWGDESRTDHFLKVARTLIAKGADVNAEDPFGKTAVYYAFQAENQCAADLLSENEADFSTLYENETNLYRVLADSQQLSDETRLEALFDFLADKACCDVNARDSRFRTPLHCAARTANLTIARKLIQYGADVNAKDSDGSTALHLAVDSREDEEGKLVEFLLASGAEVNLKNRSGERPLSIVYSSCRNVELLLQWGALINYQHNGESIFCRIFRYAGFECAMKMLAYGLDINDSCFCEFFESQSGHQLEFMTEFFTKHRIKHNVAKLPCLDHYKRYVNNPVTDREYEECCLREVSKLRSSFIDSQTSLYNYLHMDMESRVTHNNNEKLRKFVDRPEILEQEFTEYSVLILARYRTAVRWKSLLEPAKDAWLQLTHITLPDICLERIFLHMKIEDLVVFIENV